MYYFLRNFLLQEIEDLHKIHDFTNNQIMVTKLFYS